MNIKWTVGTKIGLAFAVAIIVLVVLRVIGYRNAAQLIGTAASVRHTLQVETKIRALRSNLQDAETGQRGYLLTGEESYLEPYDKGIKRIPDNLRSLRALTADNPDQQRRLDRLDVEINEKLAELRQTIDLRRSSDNADTALAVVRSGKGKQIMDNIREVLSDMITEEESLLKQRISKDHDAVSSIETKLIAFAAAAVALFCLIAYALSRSIAEPLKSVTEAARRITEGDLGVTISNIDRSDEIGVLNKAFSRMLLSLQAMAEAARRIADGDLTAMVEPQSERDALGNAFVVMISNLRKMTTENLDAVGVLSAAASEILATTTEMAASAAETSTSVNETTTTAMQVRQATEMVAQKVKAVSDNAQKMVNTSQNGRNAVDEVAEAMEQIREQMESIAESIVRLSEQSMSIGEIIATVNDLAEQSNLLAVNAAIEAVKAGDQGKGFAVVAQEVKALADQSKQATSQVRVILTDVQKSMSSAVMLTEQGSRAVQSGVKQSTEAGAAIEALSRTVADAAQAATQIAAATQQQMVGMQQITQAMENIKQAGSQNATAARQTEESARGLNDIGAKLKSLAAQYRV